MRQNFKSCLVEKQGHLLLVTLNRPEARNAIGAEMHDELEDIWDSYARDDDLWVAILTAAGDQAFCAGYDLKAIDGGGGRRLARGGTGFGGLTHRFDLTKPVIAALNGPAIGGGFELVLACDLVVADERAYVSLPEPLLGAAALAGALYRLPRQIGLKPALGILLTGRRVYAAEALQLGILNEVAPAGEALVVARRWAEQILRCAPLAVRTTKEVVYGQLDVSALRDAFETQFPSIQTLRASEDYREGPRAFLERREARWTGR